MKFWIGVVSREHALRGIAGGFMQVCHGKANPLKRMKKGDAVVFYCPKELFMGKEKCQKFLGLGTVKTGEVYQFSMSEDFSPFRLDIQYIPDAEKREASILPLIDVLSFIKDKKYWGSSFRFGHLEVPEQDFLCIADKIGFDFKQIFQAEKGGLAASKWTRDENSSSFLFMKRKTDAEVATASSELNPRALKKSRGDSEMIKMFKTEHSKTSRDISREAVWELWADVNNWPKWDVGLSSCKLEGAFEEGKIFLLTPVGSPDAISVKLQEVTPFHSFADITDLPFGKLEVFHRLEDTSQGLKVTHTVVAEVDEQKAGFFEKVIWSGMEKGVPQSVENIVKLAEINNKEKRSTPSFSL